MRTESAERGLKADTKNSVKLSPKSTDHAQQRRQTKAVKHMSHSIPPKAKTACIMTIILANAAIIALALLSSGCQIPGGSDECSVHYDGSEDCDPMITSNDLEGTWCNQRSPQTCLTVDQTTYPRTRYLLTIGLCTERGTLTGGLEFNPDTTSRMCLPGFTYGLWSAASDSFNNTGIYLYDISQCQGPVCDDDAYVYHNDLDLSYVR